MLIKGIVEGMRAVTGEYKEGKKKGEKWHFLSLEVKDNTVGEVCSCQLREDNPEYKDYVEVKTGKEGSEHSLIAGKDLRGHEVKLTVKKFSAGEMSVLQQQVVAPSAVPVGAPSTNGSTPEKEKLIKYAPTSVVCVRFQIRNIQSLGKPKADDE